jgi:hypothetical protein
MTPRLIFEPSIAHCTENRPRRDIPGQHRGFSIGKPDTDGRQGHDLQGIIGDRSSKRGIFRGGSSGNRGILGAAH